MFLIFSFLFTINTCSNYFLMFSLVSSDSDNKPDSSGLPLYPSSEELHESDEEPQPFPVDPTFPSREYQFNELWSRHDELEFRRMVQEGIIILRDGLSGYDEAVSAEKEYWNDRIRRDRERRRAAAASSSSSSSSSSQETTARAAGMTPHAVRYSSYYADPNGKLLLLLFCFFFFFLLRLL